MTLRLVLCVSLVARLALAGDPSSAYLPPDVQAIIQRLREGQRPTPAERQRLEDWQRSLKANKGALIDAEKKHLEDLRGQVPKGAQPREAPRPDGWVVAHYDFRGTVDDAQQKSTTTITGSARFPVRFTVNDPLPPQVGPVTPGAWSVSFVLDDTRACSGGFHVVTHKELLAEKAVEDADVRFSPGDSAQLGATCAAMGELLSDPAQPRPYVRTRLVLSGRHTGTSTHRDRDGVKTGTVDAPAASPLGGVSFDDQVPATFTMPGLTPAMAQVMGGVKYDAATAAALKSATFSMDMAKLREALSGGGRFDVAGDYHYVVKNDHSSSDFAVRYELVGTSEDPELVVRPEDREAYRRWVPSPFTDDEEAKRLFDPPTALTFEVALAPRRGEVAPRKAKLELSLAEVSEHQGYTTNWPVKAPSKKDLRFAKDQPDLVVDADGLTAHTKDEVSKVLVKVEALDNGAWGKLTASAPALGLTAKDPDSGQTFLTIPRDENDNHVADAWEEQLGLGGENRARLADDDALEGQRRNGDGYTLYEEYRGFVMLDGFGSKTKKYVRTDPRKKDLFVWDRDGLFATWYLPFNADLSQLELHPVDDTLMVFAGRYKLLLGSLVFTGDYKDPEHRRMNGNSAKEDLYAKQYAAVVLQDDGYRGDKRQDMVINGHHVTFQCVEGEAREVGLVVSGKGSFHQGLKSFPELRVNPTCIAERIALYQQQQGVKFTPDEVKQAVKDDLQNTVTHEFGHILGIHHHFPDGASLPPYSADWTLGTDHPWPETGESQTLGVRACAMRYASAPIDRAEFRTKHTWYNAVHYCRRFQVPMKASAKSDDCFGQIDVKMDP